MYKPSVITATYDELTRIARNCVIWTLKVQKKRVNDIFKNSQPVQNICDFRAHIFLGDSKCLFTKPTHLKFFIYKPSLPRKTLMTTR